MRSDHRDLQQLHVWNEDRQRGREREREMEVWEKRGYIMY